MRIIEFLSKSDYTTTVGIYRTLLPEDMYLGKHITFLKAVARFLPLAR